MTTAVDTERVRRVLERFTPDSDLLRVTPLTGGFSAQVTALDVRRPDGGEQRLVLRLHGERDLHSNAEVAAVEFRVLQIAHDAGIPVPEPYYLDRACDIFPAPYLVTAFAEGKTEFEPADVDDYIRQFTTQLAAIHRIDLADQDMAFLPTQVERYAERVGVQPETFNDTLDERRVRATLCAVWPLPPRNTPVLLHGDYWPGNILWQAGELSAIVDWEDTQLADPLADLAASRIEILWNFGAELMDAFTRLYLSLNPIDSHDLPYWDLCIALGPASRFAEWGEDAATQERRTLGHRAFTNRALEQIAMRGGR